MSGDFVLHINDLPKNISLHGSIAIDTEAMGLNNHRDRLCLIQLSDENQSTHLIHFKDKNFEAPNLKKILNNPAKNKIFHYARFDMAIILKYLNITIVNVFCTKIASKLCRTYAIYHSLGELCNELINIKIAKHCQISDWGTEKLTPNQLKYAANDVIYLHKIKEKLITLLKREKRFLLAEKCFQFLPTRVKLDLLGWGDQDIFTHH